VSADLGNGAAAGRTLDPNRSVARHADAERSRVAVGDGRIAGVVPVGNAEIIINGKTAGHTTLLVWTSSGRRQYDVTVTEKTWTICGGSCKRR